MLYLAGLEVQDIFLTEHRIFEGLPESGRCTERIPRSQSRH